MKRIAPLTSLVAAVSLTAGVALFAGCKSSDNDPNRGKSTAGPTESGAGGGNGEFGNNPSKAMHDNPHGTPVTTQPAQ